MKTKIYNARASQDITIDELPKQDNPNNSDLVVVQSSSLTEATSIQQLRNKILSGSESISANLGEYVFSSALIENNSLHLMDGSIGYKDQYQEFYAWLLLQADSVKQFYSLDTVAESFIFPLINNRNLKINSAISTYTGGIAQAMTNHTHRVEGEYNNSFWINQQSTAPNLTTQRRVMVQMDNNYLAKTTTARDSAGINALATGEQAYISSYMYVRVSSASNILASKSILANGTIAMDLDYTPIDMNDVATKKYIDNKFLNYPIPLSFTINDIGKRIPYYKNAETNPVLIALDGTKYLIADYPDFDYANQEGFTNDGTYFWFADLDLEIVATLNNTMNKSAYKLMPCFNDNLKGNDLLGDWTFNSKLIYNFLQSAKGTNFLIADGPNVYKSNEKFTILDANTFLIRKNYNSYINNDSVLENRPILNFKTGKIGGTEINTQKLATAEGTATGAYLGTILGEASYLKIKPDYMVAKIQQVGSAAGGGDVKSDRSVLLNGSGVFNTKQVASMDDLKDSNIIVGGNTRALITLDTKLNEVDNSINNITNNIGSVNINNLQSQVNTNTQNITSLQTQANSVYKFARKLKRTATTSLTIAGNASKRILDDVTIDSSNPYDDTTSFTLEGTTNKIIREKDDDYKELAIAITLGHTASMGATKFEVQLWRNTPTPSIVRWGSKLEFNDSDERGNTTQILTYKAGINDPYVTNGYYIVLRNLTGTVLTYSIVDILITVAKDKLLGV